MTKKTEAQSLMVAALMAATVSLGGLANCIERRLSLAEHAEVVRAIGPHPRDIASELVAPALAGAKDGESILGVVRDRHEESLRLHQGWLDSIEARRKALWMEQFLWGIVAVLCIGLGIHHGRTYRAL